MRLEQADSFHLSCAMHVGVHTQKMPTKEEIKQKYGIAEDDFQILNEK